MLPGLKLKLVLKTLTLDFAMSIFYILGSILGWYRLGNLPRVFCVIVETQQEIVALESFLV